MSGIYLTARFGDSLGAFTGLRKESTHNEDLLKCKNAKYNQHKEQTHGVKSAKNHTQASVFPIYKYETEIFTVSLVCNRIPGL